MLRILVAVDGSKPCLRAVQHALKLAACSPDTEIHLLNVQIPLSAAISSFIDREAIRGYHHDEGEAALKEARALLEQAGVRFDADVAVGQIAETIAEYAEEKHCDQIVMGTRGLSPIPNLLLGSIPTKVLHLTKVPVTLVK